MRGEERGEEGREERGEEGREERGEEREEERGETSEKGGERREERGERRGEGGEPLATGDGIPERDTRGCSLGLASPHAVRAFFLPRHCAGEVLDVVFFLPLCLDVSFS